MIEWIRAHDVTLWWLAAASLLTFMAGLVVVPLIVVRVPSDYFSQRRRRHHKPGPERHPIVRALLLLAKNSLGVVFVLAGLMMLVLPGQGILTLLVGIMLLDFPGKYRLERWVVGRRPVLRSINWIRRRAGQAPLVIDQKTLRD